jgi:hypothetical protein
MRIPLRIRITCNEENVDKIRDFLILNKLMYTMDIHRGGTTVDKHVILDVEGVVFDYEDVSLIKNSLKHYGTIAVYIGKVKIFTLNTVLSGLIVASIVFVALIAHNFNEEFYKELFEHHNTNVLAKTLIIIAGSVVSGFFLEMLVVYREKRIGDH